MPLRAPISNHLDLYRYWLAKRGSRTMPSRSSLDPMDIPALLPYLGLVDKVVGQYRYRLMGTAVVKELGRDLTGAFVGSSFSKAPESVAALQSIYERVFNTAQPVFATCEHKTKLDSIHKVSHLILPLSDDGTTVNMSICSHVERFNIDVAADIEPNGLPVKVIDVVDVDDAEGLEKLCLDWEGYWDDQRRRVEGIAEREQSRGFGRG
jgi:hypothetical protein